MKGYMCDKMKLYHNIIFSSTTLRMFANLKINFYVNELFNMFKKTWTF